MQAVGETSVKWPILARREFRGSRTGIGWHGSAGQMDGATGEGEGG